MRLRSFLVPVCSPSMRTVSLVLGMVMAASPGWAATPVVVKDGNTLQLGDVIYRLDGIDAPELDQICIDDHADPWSCGVDVRDQLARLIGKRPVRCDDHGPDKNHRGRHSGVCTVAGETTSLNQLLVRQGFGPELRFRRERPVPGRRGRSEERSPGIVEGVFCQPRAISSRQKGRRAARRGVPGRQGS